MFLHIPTLIHVQCTHIGFRSLVHQCACPLLSYLTQFTGLGPAKAHTYGEVQ